MGNSCCRQWGIIIVVDGLTNLKADYDGLGRPGPGSSAEPPCGLTPSGSTCKTSPAPPAPSDRTTRLTTPCSVRPRALNPRAVLTAADAILVNLIAGQNDDAATKAAKAARIAKFTAKGLPADFATQLQTDRVAIDTGRTTEHDADNDSVENTAAINRLVTDGMKECNYLDAIFHNVYSHNPDKLRAWMSASHLERASKSAATPAPAPAAK